MSNATTIVPIGTFTAALSLRVRELAIARAQRRAVVISMQLTERHCWSALYDLAESLRAAITPYPIRLARARPRTRALLRELGIHNEWFIEQTHPATRASVLPRKNGAPPVNAPSGSPPNDSKSDGFARFLDRARCSDGGRWSRFAYCGSARCATGFPAASSSETTV